MTNAVSIFALDSDSEEDDNLHYNIGLNKQNYIAKTLPPGGQNTAAKLVGRRVWAKVAVSHSNGFCSIRNCKYDSLNPNHACIQCKCGVHNLCVQENMLMSISKEDGHWYCSKECGGSDVLATHDVGVQQVATPTPTPTPTTTTTAATATTTTTTTPRSTDGAKIQEENLLAAEFEDCVVDPVARNQYTKKKTDLTRLRSIAGYTVRDTSVDLLRRFVCRKLTAKGTGRMGKGALCDLIATKIEDYQIAKANGTLDTRTKLQKKTAAIKIVKKWCAKRLVNVIVSNKMRNQLHLRNESITREEMNNNMKSGQFFYEQVAEIYNDPTQCTEPISPEIDDSPLDEIQGTFHWTEAKAKFNSIVKLYESARRVWKTSGNHGDFAEYNTADYLLHLHAAVEKYPGCLSQLCSKLPEEHFNESTNGSKAMPPRYQSGNTTRERKRSSDPIEFRHSPEVVELSKKKMKLLEEQFERQKEKAAARKKEKEEKKKEKEEKKKERKEKEERKKQKERTEVLSKKLAFKREIVADPTYPTISSVDTFNAKVGKKKAFETFESKKNDDPNHMDERFPDGEYSESQETVVDMYMSMDKLARSLA